MKHAGFVRPGTFLLATFVTAPLLGAWTPAAGQALSFRVEASALPFVPLQSYVHGELGEEVLFFGGVSGQGMHHIGEGAGVVAYSLPVFNDQIILVDQATSQMFTGGVGHLSPELRDALRFTTPGYVQYGETLYIYGGYGPLNSGVEWTSKPSMTEVDLPMVRQALRDGVPVPEAAFTIHSVPEAQSAGSAMVKMGDKFALIGGSNFSGDYGLGNQPGAQPFTNIYTDRVFIFDRNVSMTSPVETFHDSFWLHRRDMQALPVTVGLGENERFGFTVPGGVFNGPFPWENPLIYADGDASVYTDEFFIQKMNQYEGPHASFRSASTDVNRVVLMSGISFQIWDEFDQDFFYDFLIPWVSEITEITIADGQYVDGSEKIVGAMPLPTSNGHFVMRPNIPTNVNGQVLLDDMPHNEVLLGRVFGGISAAYPAGEPPTFASSTVYDVYVTVGLRGDVTKDGSVGFADLSVILGQFGTAGPEGDLNLDGVVDFADLSVVLSNFGSTAE